MQNINISFNFTLQNKPTMNMANGEEEYVVPFHTHKCYELIYYVEGFGMCTIDDQEYSYKKNEYFIVPNNTKHNDINKTLSVVFCVGFMISKTDEQIETGHFVDNNNEIKQYIDIMSEEFLKKEENYLEIIRNCISNIIIKTNRKNKLNDDKTNISSSLKNVLLYINENFNKDIDILKFEELSNYSYHHFRHVFKHALGISPKQYIMQKRLENAKILLTTTNSSITEIAFSCGFESSSLFTKIFKKHNDITPKKYRNQMKSDHIFSEEQTKY